MTGEEKYFDHLKELITEYSCEYVILALKQINDQQLLHLSFDELPLLDDPILKRYILVVEELEEVLFHPDTGFFQSDELKRIIQKSIAVLKKCLAESESNQH